MAILGAMRAHRESDRSVDSPPAGSRFDRQRELPLFCLAFLLFALVNYVLGRFLFGAERGFLLASGLGAALSAILSVLRRRNLALRLLELNFALTIAGAAVWGLGNSHGMAFEFLPFFGLVILYFDGLGALFVATVLGSIFMTTWALVGGLASLGLDAFITIVTQVLFTLGLAFLLAWKIELASFEASSIIDELNHRVRNSLMIARSFVLFARDGGIHERRLLALRLRAMRSVHSLLEGHLEFLSARAMVEELRKLCEPWEGGELEIEGHGEISIEKAMPLAILAAGLLCRTRKPHLLPGRRRLSLEVLAGTAVFDCRSDGGDARGKPQAGYALDPVEQGLLEQLGCPPLSEVPAGEWRLEFPSGPMRRETLPSKGPSFTAIRPWWPRRRAARQSGEQVRDKAPLSIFTDRLLGPRFPRKSPLVLRRGTILAIVLLTVFLVYLAQNLISFLLYGHFRLPGLVAAAVACLTFIPLRRGKIGWASAVFGFTYAGIVGFAVFSSPGREFGVPLYGTLPLVLYSLYFGGFVGGAAALGWGLVLHFAFLYFVGDAELGSFLFMLLVSTYAAFSIIVALMLYRLKNGVKDKERLLEDIELRAFEFFDYFLSGDLEGPEEVEVLDRQIEVAAEIHGLLSTPAEGRGLSLAAILSDAASPVTGPTRSASALRIEGEGFLPSSKLLLVLLLVAEWSRLLDEAGPSGEECGCRLSIRSARGRCVVRFECEGIDITGLRQRGAPRLLHLERRLSPVSLTMDQSSYRLAFVC